ncbi:MAG: TonB family protein [Candidatus Omnitrophota bacterium]
MQGKNIFGIALSCSIIWHLVGFGAINIVCPEQLLRPEFAPVNFLGAILDRPAARIDVVPEILPQAQGLAGKSIPRSLEKETLPFSELSNKAIPDTNAVLTGPKQFMITEVLGEGFRRGIIQKPALPVCPEWAKKLSSDFEIQLKFLILPEGTVGTVEKITSSGYPELDEIGVRYIRKWKFMPLAEDSLLQEQWGNIKLLFKIK